MTPAATLQRPAPRSNQARAPGFGLYVHWPFCQSKCPYCDFNSHVRETVDQARWRNALLRELDHYAALTPGRTLTSIFFGGGTPSLMQPETVATVIAKAGECWRRDDDIEVTLEANPSSVEAGRFRAYREAGVNRVSLGVQSFDDTALAFLGRRHSAAEAAKAVELARRIFPRFSFDLIYALPEQTAGDWSQALTRALNEAPSHLSVYQLTIEERTAFHGAQRRGELKVPDETRAAQLFEITQERLETAGLPAYEISNHAAPDDTCRHNLTYWRYGDYVGIGPGAHGRLTLKGEKRATRQHRAPEAWLANVETKGHATRQDGALTRDERLNELVMMGLRTKEGIARDAFRRELGAEPESLFPEPRLGALADAGYVVLDDDSLRATGAGRRRLNALLAYLLDETVGR